MNVSLGSSAMINEIGTAWLLHKKPVGDSSLHLTFLTQANGLMHCRFRGARSLKKQAPMQVLTPMWLAVATHHDWQYVHKLEITAPSLKIGGLSLFAALYVNELLYYILHPEEPCAELFAGYEATLEGLSALSNRLAIEIVLRRFEKMVLAVAGHALVLEEEGESNQPIAENAFYQFRAGQGFIRSDKGFPGYLICAWAQEQWHDLQVLKLAKLVMRQALDHLLDGRPLKSRALFQTM